jgi:hypothetical protein
MAWLRGGRLRWVIAGMALVRLGVDGITTANLAILQALS